MSQTISVSTTMGEQGFRDFAVFDAFHHRKAWLRPAVFAAIMLAFAAVSKSKTARKLVQIFVTIFRNTPILILVYITYFGMPTIGINIPKVPSFVITLALYSSAYMEEVFRAGLEAIPKGIIEAGQAIGLSGTVIKMEIELPIMMKKVLPSMGNYLISLFKDT